MAGTGRTHHLLALLVTTLLLGCGQAAEDDEKNGPPPANDEKGGVKAGEGDRLKGEVPGKPTETIKTVVDEDDFCELLRDAAKTPGAVKQVGKLRFVGHAPWIAELICEYVKERDALARRFADVGPRREFLTTVLDAIGANTALDTSVVDRDRLVVGEQPYSLTLIRNPDGTIERKDPKKRRFYVARSFDRPTLLLLAAHQEAFLPDPKPKGELEWIQAAERFILRIHSLLSAGERMLAMDLDEPPPTLGAQIEAATVAFKSAHNLSNSGDYRLGKEVELGSDAPPTERPEPPPPAPRMERSVQLTLSREPQRSENGLTLFQYAPMTRPPGEEWFIAALRAGSPGLDAAGITLPISSFSAAPPTSGFLLDRLFDERSEGGYETRFQIDVACAVRLHYYEAGANTEAVRRHELRHHEGIAASWDETLRALEGSLLRLIARLNEDLGLPENERFALESSTVLKPWPVKKGDEFASALPDGFVSPGDTRLRHVAHPVPFRSLRVTRRSAKLEPIRAIVARVERTRSPDPSYAKAEALWTSWLKETGGLRRFRWIFDRQYLGRGLDLDAREGVMRADGSFGPDPRITAEKIREFRRLTAPTDDPKENPQQAFDRLFGRR